MPPTAQPLLFTPTKLREVALRNRVVISPMCTYSADGGLASDWHLVHLGQFALGGAGVVFTEVTSVTEQGRITYGDLGLWSSAHVAPLARIAAMLRAHGAVPAIQLGHSGRKASVCAANKPATSYMARFAPPSTSAAMPGIMSICSRRSFSSRTILSVFWRFSRRV